MLEMFKTLIKDYSDMRLGFISIGIDKCSFVLSKHSSKGAPMKVLRASESLRGRLNYHFGLSISR